MVVPQITMMSAVNRQAQQNSSVILCDGCGIEISKNQMLTRYSFRCCSTKCMQPLCKPLLDKEEEREKEIESKRSRHGAFTLSSGGGRAY